MYTDAEIAAMSNEELIAALTQAMQTSAGQGRAGLAPLQQLVAAAQNRGISSSTINQIRATIPHISLEGFEGAGGLGGLGNSLTNWLVTGNHGEDLITLGQVATVGGIAASAMGPAAGAGTGAGTGATTAGGAAAGTATPSLLGSIVGTGGSNIPAWLGLIGNLWAANQIGSNTNPGAPADPFASQRPMYQRMLQELLANPNSFLESPYFQAQLQTGLNAVNRGAANTGLLGSGNRLLALQNTGSTLAQTSLMNYITQLATLAGANTGSPAAAAGINQTASMNQINAYLQALQSTAPLLTQFSNWAME